MTVTVTVTVTVSQEVVVGRCGGFVSVRPCRTDVRMNVPHLVPFR